MRALRIGTSVLLTVLVVLLLVVGIPKLFGVRYFSVLSDSMAPAIPAGSLVVAVPTNPVTIKVGDVISYATGEGTAIVTQRVIGRDDAQNAVITRGDQSEGQGITVPRSSVIGLVRISAPWLGYPLNLFSSVPGKILLITGVVSLILIMMIVNILTWRHSSSHQLVLDFEDANDLTREAFLAEKLRIEQGR